MARNEIITVAKNAADAWRGTDQYHQAAQIIDMLVDELENPTITPPNEALPVLVNDEPDREYIDYICPRCKNTISQRRRGQRMETVYQCKYHDNCGQRVDWENPHRLTAASRREKHERKHSSPL